jgi:hypothetical protein
MSVMRAQYKVSNAPALAVFREIKNERDVFNAQASDLAREFGFTAAHELRGRVVGFSGNSGTSAFFRRDSKLDLWVPNERANKGKRARERMDAVRYRDLSETLNALFEIDFILDFQNRIQKPVWGGRLGDFLIVNVPFTDENRQDKMLESHDGFTLLTPSEFMSLANTIAKQEG